MILPRYMEIYLAADKGQSYSKSQNDYQMILGGKSLAAKILYDELPANINPLAAENLLAIGSAGENMVQYDCAIPGERAETSYDPRYTAGFGLGYVAANRGACHLGGGFLRFLEVLSPVTISGLTARGEAALTVFAEFHGGDFPGGVMPVYGIYSNSPFPVGTEKGESSE